MSNRFAALDLEAEKRQTRQVRSKPSSGPAAAAPTVAKASATKPAAAAAPAVGGSAAKRDPRANPKAAGEGRQRVRHGADKEAGDKPGAKRVFDKYSHSGKLQVAKDGKKSGGGRFNWGGKTETELEALADPAAVASVEAASAEGAEGEAKSTVPVEEDEPQRTYAEFLAQQKAEAARVKAQIQVRRAGEGEDAAAWASFQPLVRVDDSASFGVAPKKAAKKAKKTNKAEAVIPTDKLFKIQAASSSEPKPRGERPARGGRGRDAPRGGARPPRAAADEASSSSSSTTTTTSSRGLARGAHAGRGGAKGGRGAAVALDDKNAFPGLPSSK
ncbi:MAG: hypothetical protein Q8P67_24900 [archaeon]|nr:hypothetical protein [archaeon]